MSAAKDVEATLKNDYTSAVHSNRTEGYKEALRAASNLVTPSKLEFTAKEWRMEIKKLTQKEIKQQSLNNYVGKLKSEGRGKIIEQIREAVYKFRDPRMASYIKIVNSDI